MKQYDVIIIGAGPSGIFCAYELIHAKKNLKILMIEKGRRIEKRECPKRKTKVCVGCKPCSITTGFAGAGAFSDGKLSLSPDVGGNLPEILGYDKTVELLKESDDIYLKFGADTKVYGVDKEKEIREIRRKAINANLKLIECPIRHLGTEEGYKIYSRLQEHLLEQGVEMEFNTMVKDIIIEDNKVKGIITEKDEEYLAAEVISAVGREGADWFSHICGQHDIETNVGTVDIGVRVEVRDEVMEFLNQNLYEAKLVYHTPTFDDKVRTFCTNPSGEVATEYYDNGLDCAVADKDTFFNGNSCLLTRLQKQMTLCEVCTNICCTYCVENIRHLVGFKHIRCEHSVLLSCYCKLKTAFLEFTKSVINSVIDGEHLFSFLGIKLAVILYGIFNFVITHIKERFKSVFKRCADYSVECAVFNRLIAHCNCCCIETI